MHTELIVEVIDLIEQAWRRDYEAWERGEDFSPSSDDRIEAASTILGQNVVMTSDQLFELECDGYLPVECARQLVFLQDLAEWEYDEPGAELPTFEEWWSDVLEDAQSEAFVDFLAHIERLGRIQ